MSQILRYELISNPDDVGALKQAWMRLYASNQRASTVFMRYSHIVAWINTFANYDDKQRLAIVVGRRDGEVALILPLVVSQSLGIKKLQWLGLPLAQYGDMLIAPELTNETAGAEAIAFALEESGADLMELRRVRDDAALAPALRVLHARVSNEDSAPFLDLSSAPSAEDYELRYKKKRRRNRTRLFERLSAHNDVKYDVFSPGPTADSVLSNALTLKREWLEDKGQISVALSDPRTDIWASELARTPDSKVRVAGMFANDTLIAAQMGLQHDEYLAVFLIVYALKYDTYGVGALHIERTIRESYQEGIKTIDLLPPCSDYKMRWADGAVPLADYTMAITAKGRLMTNRYMLGARANAKQLYARLPNGIRHSLGGWFAFHQQTQKGALIHSELSL